MRIEATAELVNMINAAAGLWKTDPRRTPGDNHFDLFCEKEWGLKIDFVVAEDKVMVHGATITDEDKYVNFLLTFGSMPNE